MIVFYHGDWDDQCLHTIQSFSEMKTQFDSAGCQVAACSSDGAKVHKSWIQSERSDGGFGGKLEIPLWSDPSGALASQFDLFDEEENQIFDGIVIIDDAGVVRHAMTTSMESNDTATNCLELVKILKVYTNKDNKANSAVKKSSAPVVTDKDWDVSRDPGLLKALEVAKRLGQPQPAHMVFKPKNPTFELAPSRIRRMVNPKASVLSCSAAVFRNLSGFGKGAGIKFLGYYLRIF